jgi:hypothetical protein
MKRWIISALLRIYPAAWRAEYGPELHDLLLAQPLGVRIIADVAWNGARQRLRTTEPWVLLGLPFALLATAWYALLILAPPPYPQPGAQARLFVLVAIYNLLLPLSCGLWTVVRSGGTPPHAGLQTTKMALLIAAPSFIVYTLVLAGVLGVVVVGPGDTPTTFAQHGFAIAVYKGHHARLPVDVGTVNQMVARYLLFLNTTVGQFVAKLVNLPLAWLGGALGGALGHSIRSKLQRTH